jgi:DNA-binding transcriptional MerR regulator
MSQITKIYWSMSETRELLRTTDATIRNWCDWFQVNCKRNRKGNRLFNRQNIYRLQVIHILLNVEGYTVKGVQRELGL